MVEEEKKWTALASQSDDQHYGEEYEAPVELFCFHVDAANDFFTANEITSIQDGWYDLVYYCSMMDDGYINGRSNNGLLKITSNKEGGKIHAEIRPSAQEFLEEYCGLKFFMDEKQRHKGAIETTFQAPQRFEPDMQLQNNTAKLRILKKPIATGLGKEGDEPGYGAHISPANAQRMQASGGKKPCPVFCFEPGDLVINSFWSFMGDNYTEVCFVARKRASC